MKLVIVEYGVGNLGAIPNMLRRLGADAEITSEPATIRGADKVILPGVGSFDAAAAALRRLELTDVLHEVKAAGIPILGLCLGMELMGAGSEEGKLPGLNWIPGRVVRFRLPEGGQLSVPHMGWNYVQPAPGWPLLDGLGDAPRFYFAHSYHFECENPADVAASTTYGYEFPSAIRSGNVTGIQFHPEKSHRFGLKLFENFLGA